MRKLFVIVCSWLMLMGMGVAAEAHPRPRQDPRFCHMHSHPGIRHNHCHEAGHHSKAAAAPAQSAPTGGGGDVKGRIAAAWPGDDAKALRVVSCETGGTFNPAKVSKSGKFRGLWQFSRSTWAWMGGSGDPAAASVEEQTQRAWKLWSLPRSKGGGPQHWPECSKR